MTKILGHSHTWITLVAIFPLISSTGEKPYVYAIFTAVGWANILFYLAYVAAVPKRATTWPTVAQHLNCKLLVF
jgi:hypothetical protein